MRKPQIVQLLWHRDKETLSCVYHETIMPLPSPMARPGDARPPPPNSRRKTRTTQRRHTRQGQNQDAVMRRLDDQLNQINDQLGRINNQLGRINNQLGCINNRLDAMDNRTIKGLILASRTYNMNCWDGGIREYEIVLMPNGESPDTLVRYRCLMNFQATKSLYRGFRC